MITDLVRQITQLELERQQIYTSMYTTESKLSDLAYARQKARIYEIETALAELRRKRTCEQLRAEYKPAPPNGLAKAAFKREEQKRNKSRAKY